MRREGRRGAKSRGGGKVEGGEGAGRRKGSERMEEK